VSQVLRDYQQQALLDLSARVRAGERRILLVAPTGSGKTTIAAEMIRRATGKGNGVLFIAHRKELIDQCSTRLDGVGVGHGIIMADHPRWLPWESVQVASIQTLLRRRDKLPAARILIVDEAHHARADSYHTVIDDLYPGAVALGLTATPWRIDGRGLGDLFQSTVVASTPAALIRAGHLVPYTGFAFDRPDLSGVRTTAGDYNEADVAAVMNRRELLGNIVGQWQSHAGGKRTVVFACDVKHSKDICERFRAVGVTAEHLDAKTPKLEREAILARLSSGATTVVCNVAVLTEGWDCPAVECIILARPTQSLALYLQMVGRAMRPNPETGKTVCRVHDHASNIISHGLPDAERDYTLTTNKRKAKLDAEEAAQSIRMCSACYAVFPGTLPACPVCGFVNPKRLRLVSETDEAVAISLEEMKKYARPYVPERESKEAFDAMLAKARERGYKDTWASIRFKEKFGFFPKRAWR
jgi:superfamily II DNA or RNA helicase